ncbi:hypothetical protein [Chryseobacterium geocarposphaerae]|uniref:Lipoprotein n=1 Tax=Chryseobacterium geocarposphaerae TaxID=1416776 RepID=A0A2M9C9Z9_9FLAO|nr:hypothetical protein [Chryseobacterium geocarposphaerae]PJJ67676.1 hypothetical protein CLV73_1694 [Chryseobacterium geocarposphaerae]
MKKIAFIALVIGTLMVSCQNEQRQAVETPETVETLKADAVNNFESALKAISKGGERYVGENKLLNEEGIKILLPAATQLALDKGISEVELQRLSKRDIIEKGLRIYQENIAIYRTKVKSNN